MNPTVLITGAAGGIGRATVKYFAAQGWRVLAVDRAADFGDVNRTISTTNTDCGESVTIIVTKDGA